MKKREITILGAGLVGSLLALLFEQRGYQVKVYERRSDMRKNKLSAGRSINLAMSVRGWSALEMAGIKKEMEDISIPMLGREIHMGNEPTKFQYYGKNEEAIYSISRGELNKRLMELAEKGGVEFFFDHKCEEVNIDTNEITFSTQNGESKVKADLLIGGDGAFSALRTAYTKKDRYNYEQFYVEHGYKELNIPPGPNGEHLINKEALHIWPRKNYMVIALPNQDGSFTCTLFFPYEGTPSFNSIKTKEDVQAFFEEQFPDAVPLMPALLDDYFENPTASLVTVRCSPWYYEEKSLIIGDAAHAIVPFYGQGMNAGFEDCRILMELIDRHGDDKWDIILKHYNTLRVENGRAISDLALKNFIEMRDLVADPEFLRRKKLEKEIGRLFPDRFNSVYEMVSFSNKQYSYAQDCQKAQDRLMAKVLADPTFQNGEIDEKEKPIIENWLRDYEEEVSAFTQ